MRHDTPPFKGCRCLSLSLVSHSAGLSEGEAALFRQVVSQCSADHFTASDAPLVVAYVQAVLLSRSNQRKPS
jgi:dihydroxyacetone kinase DhaKLM complex PTS-EIIA-like component DhaM